MKRLIRKMTTVLGLWLALAVTAASLGGCKKEEQTLRIGMMADVCSIPYEMAMQKGYYEELGVPVEIQYFKSAQDRESALQANQLDAVSSDMVSLVLLKNGGKDFRAVTGTYGIYRIVGTPEVSAVSELGGKKIGLSTSTLMEFAVDYVLAKENIADAEKVNIPQMPVRLQMLEEKQIDAAIMPEPYVAAALESGGSLLADLKDYGLKPGILLVSGEYIKNNPSALKKLAQAYDKAVDYLNASDTSEYMESAAQAIGFSAEAMLKADFMPFYKMALPDEDGITAANTWLYERGVVPEMYTASGLMYEIK